MKQYLLLLSFFITSALSAQVSYNPDALAQVGNASDEYMEVNFNIVNDLADNAQYLWTFEDEGLVEGWDAQLCDMTLCYNWGFSTCPADAPNNFDPNQSFGFFVKVRPKGIPGEGTLIVNITDLDYNVLLSFPIDFTANMTSSVNDDTLEKLSVYPNPTQDFFQIRNDEQVNKIAIYNIVGKALLTENHITGNAYNISDFQKGVYLVRTFDEYDNVIKVFRLNKN